ncbi:pyrimidine transporter [Escherichia coli]|uniref:Pyrimidine transporter n=1 Tax=Escherichia coli TaxID=562 RepID=A0A376THK2_ECOLX|nr:pyrimidine transporter [Escherichia coli]
MTVLCIGLVAVFTRGMIQRLLILVGLIVACLLYGVMTNVLGLGKAVDFTLVSHAAWFGLPHFSTPAFNGQAMMLIAPVAVILVAENLGHLKAVAGMTGRNMDPYMGRAFVGDGLATMLSGSVGGSGVTTYAEEYRCNGRDKSLLDAGVCRCCRHRHAVGLFTEIWRADSYHSGRGDWWCINCCVRADCRRRRKDMGTKPCRFKPER